MKKITSVMIFSLLAFALQGCSGSTSSKKTSTINANANANANANIDTDLQGGIQSSISI